MNFADLRRLGPYQSYAYAYPHKTAYRRFARPRPLADLWAEESLASLFLYVHIPFCEMRCGFCNLFTERRSAIEDELGYVQQVLEHASAFRQSLGRREPKFASMAIGGGTPTMLSAGALHNLLEGLEHRLGLDFCDLDWGIECSPATIDGDKLDVLRRFGVARISMGVQSWHPDILKAMGRPQSIAVVERALEQLCRHRNYRLNLDLIYGAAGQTPERWLESLERSLSYRPDEIYLYPLYVRPRTGLDKRRLSRQGWDEQRLELYRIGRERLQAAGYVAHSMRHFVHSGTHIDPTRYRCQADGMVGLGVGARSYTTRVHYSSAYAVSNAATREIITAYRQRSREQLALAHVGFELNDDERRRRFLIQSLLQSSGLDARVFSGQFGRAPEDYFEQLHQLRQGGWVQQKQSHWRLTPEGLAHSDAIGPFFQSPAVARLAAGFELR